MRKITKELLESPRPTYIRIARSGVPVIYDEETEFKIGKAHRLTDGKDAAIIVCGQLVATALQAAEELKEEGIDISVVDMYTIKPLDTEMIEAVAKRMRMYSYTGRAQSLWWTWRCCCRGGCTDRNGSVRHLRNSG